MLIWANASELSINSERIQTSFFMLLHLSVMFSRLGRTTVRMPDCGRPSLLIGHTFWSVRLGQSLECVWRGRLRLICVFRGVLGHAPAKGSEYECDACKRQACSPNHGISPCVESSPLKDLQESDRARVVES
jgi:hypothetical protein